MQDIKANYVVIEDTSERVVIRDMGPWDKYPTVTNVAEEVVKELITEGQLQPAQRLFYYDSHNDFSEILIKNGKFFAFSFYE